MDRYIEQLRRGEYLKESEVKSLCVKAREILVDESNVQRVDAPVTVSVMCRGRICREGYDLKRRFRYAGTFTASFMT